MEYAVCQLGAAAVRAEDSDRSEMVTQILFGEKVLITETKNNWIRIKADFDSYEGWADKKQFIELNEEAYQQIGNGPYTSDIFNLALDGNQPMVLPMGASLPNIKDDKIFLGDKKFLYHGEIEENDLTKSELTRLAQLYLNTPYLWGGKSNFGIDCSGLTQQVYKYAGKQIPRDAFQQAELGETLSFVEEAEAGDLAFFDNAEGKIIHVGILLNDNKIIHAHGRVRIDPIDSTGIFNTDAQLYSHKLRVIKRIL
ncbi:MAG: C40 family peptidase [Weeksellaceae bacterium]|jgi:hypothetical protein|nr:C40 family peptidase [Weeksellaceae bacterium]